MKQRLPIGLIVLWAILLVLAGSIFSATSTVVTVYNTMVQSKVRVEQALGNLDSVYQRRYALVDNLVVIVKETKGFEQYQIEIEKEIYPRVAEAKAGATRLTVEAPEATSQQMVKESKFNSGLMQVLDKLLILAQHYPQITDPILKDRNATFDSLRDLKASLVKLEDDVLDQRKQLNGAVQAYNQNIQIFPANLFAAGWGFTHLTGFEVLTPEARADVKVAF